MCVTSTADGTLYLKKPDLERLGATKAVRSLEKADEGDYYHGPQFEGGFRVVGGEMALVVHTGGVGDA